jgi:hypothetical protein
MVSAIFSNLSLHIYMSPIKLKNRKSYSQFQRYRAYVYYLKSAVTSKLCVQFFVSKFFQTQMNV